MAARWFLTPDRRRTLPGEARVLARARRLLVDVEGRKHTAYTWGEASAPAVILVHGWNGSAAQMTAVVEPLLERRLRVIAADATAHGESPGRHTSAKGMGLVVRAVARVADQVVATVAHSAGATAAVWAASHGVELGRLALIAPGVRPTDWMESFAGAVGLTGRAAQAFHEEVWGLARARPDQVDVEANAPDVHAEVLVLHDRDDRMLPVASARAVTRRFPRAELVETQGLGHRRILRDPVVIDRVVRFAAGG